MAIGKQFASIDAFRCHRLTVINGCRGVLDSTRRATRLADVGGIQNNILQQERTAEGKNEQAIRRWGEKVEVEDLKEEEERRAKQVVWCGA